MHIGGVFNPYSIGWL